MLTTAVAAAFGSAATFAVSTSVQHQAAEQAPESATGVVGLLGYLVRKPTWLLGQALAAMAFSLHAVALHNGPLAVVQPIVISGIVWAVPARAALSRRLPSAWELRAVAVTALGLASFLVASAPSAGHDARRDSGTLVLVLGGVALAACANTVAALVHRVPRRRAFFLGSTAGVLFGLVAGLLKMVLDTGSHSGFSGVLTTWPTYVLLVVGAGGVLTNQRAYRVAGLSASMPALNFVNVVVALLFGYTVFGEVPRHTPVLLLVQALALAAIGLGLWLLVRLEEDFLDHPGGPRAEEAAEPEETAELEPRRSR